MTTETDRLLNTPAARSLTLSDGTEVVVERIRTRQLLRLLRIITSGAADAVFNLNYDEDEQEAFYGQLLGLVVMSIPAAEDETVDFVRSLVSPANVPEGRDKASKEARRAAESALDHLLYNPEIEDLVEIISVVVRAEAPEVMALGKKIRSLLAVSTSQGSSRSTDRPTPTPTDSPEPSPSQSTLFSLSTDG